MKGILERVAYHEAGHALLAFTLKFDDELSVIVFSQAQQNHIGMTRYLRDKFRNLMMNPKHGRSLIQIGFGGCAAEELYCQQNGLLFEGCQYGSEDDEFINGIIKEMNLDAREARFIQKAAREDARSFIQRNSELIQNIAGLLLDRIDRECYYSDLAAIILKTL
jgi:hypothetical protein